MQNRQEPNQRQVRLKNNNIFEVLLKNMENLSKLDQDLYTEKFDLIGNQNDQYFRSQGNKRLLIEYYILHIHREYFDMSADPSKGKTHLLFRKEISGLARDFVSIKKFILLNCPTLQKVIRNSKEDVSVWLLEKLLSTNLELLKEPNSQHLC